jgi:DNA-binding NarL/FixJ family response regulator
MTVSSMWRPVATSAGQSGEPPNTAILVVDDHVSFAEALAFMLDDVPGLHAFVATTIEQAWRTLAEQEVDVVLLELDLDAGDGIRFARQALAEHRGVRVVAVTASEDERRLVDAVRAGIAGWVPKREPVEQVVATVRGVLRGETWIPPPLLTRLVAELISAQRDAARRDQPLAALTGREREILDCLMWGMTTNDIAQRLHLSRNTLRTHIQNILRKLDVHSILAAVALARRSESGHHGGDQPPGERPTPWDPHPPQGPASA